MSHNPPPYNPYANQDTTPPMNQNAAPQFMPYFASQQPPYSPTSSNQQQAFQKFDASSFQQPYGAYQQQPAYNASHHRVDIQAPPSVNPPPPPSNNYNDAQAADDPGAYYRSIAWAHIDPREQPKTRNTALFLSKVYSILLFQLGITVFVIALFYFVPPLTYLAENFFYGLFFGSLIGSIVVLLVMFCVRRIPVVNVIALTLFTALFSISVGIITAQYNLGFLFQAAIITFIVTAFLSVLVIVTRAKLMWMGSLLCTGIMVLICTAFVGSLFSWVFRISPWWQMLISGFAALLFSGMIAYDTSMMVHRYNDNDAMLASVNLYLDVVNLFLALLSILGIATGNRR